MANEDDFIFLDPPYDFIFSDYGNAEYKDGFTEQDHIKLASLYKQLKCKAIMVISRIPLTEKLYSGMIIDECGKSYAVNIRNRFKSKATHMLISNYGNIANECFPESEFDERKAIFATAFPRTPTKMIPVIELLHTHFSGMEWNSSTQKKFMDLSREENFFDG